MGSDELTSATARRLADAIAGRECSALEVVEAHLRRIDDVNGAINAVVQVDAERALARAREADEALAAGDRWGPLHGVPFTVKDNISAAGIPMAIGARERVGVVADEDATVVGRLAAAGAILLGKTNCPEYGGGIETDNEVYGRTSNPYDLARTPGGSSGGEAAIVAAHGSPCGLGTDSGASARLPAHFCGLASIKPSAGRVPLTGVLDDEGQLGTLGDPADVDLRELRVAVQAENALAAPTPATVATVWDAASALRRAGAVVVEARHPAGGHELTIAVWQSYGSEM